jgi:chromosomal replication initiation ATPase DnaA
MATIASSPSIAVTGAPTQEPETLARPVSAEGLSAASDRILVRRVIKVTASHFGMTVENLLAKRRTQPLCQRRQIAMYVARELTGGSLPFIADRMGFQDHTTVLHGVRLVKARLDAGDAATVAAVAAIVERLLVVTGRA